MLRLPLLLALLALSSGVASLACGVTVGGTKVRCVSSSCSGCCDVSGTCQPGHDAAACGLNGASCASCANGQSCGASSGVCQSGPDGSGGGQGTLDGGDGCAAEARLIYVVDSNRTLSSFDPSRIGTASPFTDLGRLSCPAELGAEPFSMAVDRNAVAWVIYDSGELFTVSLKSSLLTCDKTTFTEQQDIAKFGMSFVSNAPGSTLETLYIAGSPLGSTLSSTKLGTLSTTPPYAISVISALAGAPELTGTGDAKLWAFFPGTEPPRVSQLDKATGGALQSYDVAQLSGSPRAWAFAFWGGDFWVFLERVSDSSTNVWRVSQDGGVVNAVADTARRIVGAGVSTCAPVTIN